MEEDASQGAFDPQRSEHISFTELPDEIWQPMLQSKCAFEPEMFLRVMQNLIKNPNIMSTHLFRADILYDSQKDHSIVTEPGDVYFSEFTRHMKKELQPIYTRVPGYKWQQTYVRQLVPRNRQLDNDLVQTCHFYMQQTEKTVSNLILYIPHITTSADMPWYHPRVRQVAFLHQSTLPSSQSRDVSGIVSVHYCLFPDFPVDQRLERTAMQLLDKIHKHSRGQQAGYVKRVHHDQIVPQQRFQDTYARLKAKYARDLIDKWVEQTDPAKHVFEDLGIAAFLMELWADMYDCGGSSTTDGGVSSKPKFPGFVDIGCGNGLLINILDQEGYPGWGFDARRRKTWETFSPEVRDRVKEMVLVPEIFDADEEEILDRSFHNGIFNAATESDTPEPPFVVSNHADELTPWTPLLAYLNGSSFIAIPCCSHNLSGARWRAPASKSTTNKQESVQDHSGEAPDGLSRIGLRQRQAAETGSLKKPPGAKKQPSAYASLCDYVTGLGSELGYTVEKEMLRIPSTRNACLLGRLTGRTSASGEDTGPTGTTLSDPSLRNDDTDAVYQNKRKQVQEMVTRELGAALSTVREEWILQARKIAGKKGEAH